MSIVGANCIFNPEMVWNSNRPPPAFAAAALKVRAILDGVRAHPHFVRQLYVFDIGMARVTDGIFSHDYYYSDYGPQHGGLTINWVCDVDVYKRSTDAEVEQGIVCAVSRILRHYVTRVKRLSCPSVLAVEPDEHQEQAARKLFPGLFAPTLKGIDTHKEFESRASKELEMVLTIPLGLEREEIAALVERLDERIGRALRKARAGEMETVEAGADMVQMIAVGKNRAKLIAGFRAGLEGETLPEGTVLICRRAYTEQKGRVIALKSRGEALPARKSKAGKKKRVKRRR
ncbi:MAG: hypothetical protein JSR77_12120 [Planctomycetes bacterium]|nr:hypothetical protein [Planctomycetota bacterium]